MVDSLSVCMQRILVAVCVQRKSLQIMCIVLLSRCLEPPLPHKEAPTTDMFNVLDPARPRNHNDEDRI